MGLSRPYTGEPAIRREVPSPRKFDRAPALISTVSLALEVTLRGHLA